MMIKCYATALCGYLLLTGAFLNATDGAFAAESASERRYRLFQHGTFVLSVPRAWTEDVRQPPGGLPPTITFSSPRLPRFLVLVTPIWSRKSVTPENDPARIRALVEDAAAAVASSAVESTLPLLELSGSSGTGYYFSATDRAPKPDEFEFLTQGAIAVRDLAVTFTILTNEKESQAVPQALKMLQNAGHVPQ